MLYMRTGIPCAETQEGEDGGSVEQPKVSRAMSESSDETDTVRTYLARHSTAPPSSADQGFLRERVRAL
jgi:hypothetical protein